MVENNIEKKLGILMGTLVLAALAFSIVARNLPDTIEESSESPMDKWVADRVNNHIFYQAKEIELQEDLRKHENQYLAPEIGQRVLPGSLKSGRDPLKSGIDHSPDANETNAIQDLNRDPKRLEVFNPNNQINSALADAQMQQEYNEAYREAYVKQFLANARKAGFEVTLDKDYRIINVRQIPKTQGGVVR